MQILLPTLHVRPSAQAIPLAAGCLKSSLPQSLRQQTLLLDLFPGPSLGQQAETILASQPQVVAFPLYLWNRDEALSLSRELRRQKPELFLLAGGPEASADSGQVMSEGQLNGVIVGEGEQPFARLMEALDTGRLDREIPGYLAAGSETAPGQRLLSCPDLSQLPSPWLQGDLPLCAEGGVLWEIARGCPFNCAFCYDAKGHQGVRQFPEARLRAELELFIKRQVSQVWVLDSTFNAPAERGKRLLKMLLEQAPPIHFHFEAKADFLDEETVELLSRLSCSVQIGLQSANPEVLQPLHRSFHQSRMEKQLGLLNQAGITFGLDLIFGLPGDNFSGFCRSLDFALGQQPNQVDIFPLAVLPGTELHQQQQQFGISADSRPPYLIRENRSFSGDQLEQSRKLASAADLFYNRGRAVGFFQQLCACPPTSPSQLLSDFSGWLEEQAVHRLSGILTADRWRPAEILPLQLAFANQRLTSAGLKNLVPLCEDFIHYHYFCAELLLAADCRPADRLPAAKQWQKTAWKLNPQVRIHEFNYALDDLEMLGGLSWKKLAKQLRKEQSFAIFFRQEGQPIIESIEADFARLLLAANDQQAAGPLLQRRQSAKQDQLFRLAVTEGLLIPTT